MPPISAIIITLNEEANIGRCLESLRGICDEIVVVDSLSVDATPDICRSMGARVYSREFPGFRDQKNHAASLAVNDLILSIDADEELSPRLRESLARLASDNEAFDYYRVKRLNMGCNKAIRHSALYPDKKIRVYNRRSCRWGGLNIHETVIPGKKSRGRLLRGDLIHHAFNSLEELEVKLGKYAMISAGEYFHDGKRAGPLTAPLHAAWRFYKCYIAGRGVAGGGLGFRISMLYASSVYKKYKGLRSLQKAQKPSG